LALQRRHLQRPAKRRLAERDRHLAVQLQPLPDEQLVLPDPHHTVQIAWRSARFTGLTLAGQPDLHAVVDAGLDDDRRLALDLGGGGGETGAAGGGGDGTLAGTGATGLVDAKEAVALDDDAGPTTTAAGLTVRAGLGPGACALVAALLTRDLDLLARAL